MKRIHKFFLVVQDETQVVEMPYGAKVIHVGEQYGHPVMWAEFDTSFTDNTEYRRFRTIGTGWDFDDAEHRGTVVMKNGYVWHIYEEQ